MPQDGLFFRPVKEENPLKFKRLIKKHGKVSGYSGIPRQSQNHK